MPVNRKSTIGLMAHHSVTPMSWSMAQLRNVFRQRFGVNYVGYNRVIFPDGHIESDIGDDGFGIHNNHGAFNNSNTVGICLMGDFTSQGMPRAMEESLKNEIIRLAQKYNIPIRTRLFGHRQYYATACPSNNVYNWLVQFRNSYGNNPPSTVSFPRIIKVMVPELNVRQACQAQCSSNCPLVQQPTASGKMEAGNTFYAVGYVRGENVGGNDIWLKSGRGNCVFSGGTDFKLIDTPPVTPGITFPKLIKVMVPYLNVRAMCQDKCSSNCSLVRQPTGSGKLEAGNTFYAVGWVRGENVGGNDIWLKSGKGNCVFSGGTDFRL